MKWKGTLPQESKFAIVRQLLQLDSNCLLDTDEPISEEQQNIVNMLLHVCESAMHTRKSYLVTK